MPEGRGSQFRPQDRLATGAQFRAVLRRGWRVEGPLFVLLAARNEAGRHRLGLTVSRRLGKAAVRNRAKRLLRESFRRTMIDGGETLDLLLIPKRAILLSGQAEVDREYRACLRRLAARRAGRPRGPAGAAAD